MSLQYTGNSAKMVVTLGSAYTAASGSMVLTTGHGSKLPSEGDFWLGTSEGTFSSFKCTARSEDTLTIVSAQDGTVDTDLDAGTELFWDITASALNQLRADLCVRTDVGSEPTGSKEGRIWVPTKGISIARDNGSSLNHYGPIYSAGSGVPRTEWTSLSSGGETVTNLNGGRQIVSPASTGDYYQYRTILLSSPFSIVVCLTTWWRFQDDMRIQAGLLESTGEKNICINIAKNNSEVPWVAVVRREGVTWDSDAYLNLNNEEQYAVFTRFQWMKVSFDGTNVSFYLSPDGVYWDLLLTETVATYLTNNPDSFIWGVGTAANRKTVGTLLLYREEDDT